MIMVLGPRKKKVDAMAEARAAKAARAAQTGRDEGHGPDAEGEAPEQPELNEDLHEDLHEELPTDEQA